MPCGVNGSPTSTSVPDPSAAVFHPSNLKPGLLSVPCVGAVMLSPVAPCERVATPGAPLAAVLLSKVTVAMKSRAIIVTPSPPAPPEAFPAPPPPPPPPVFAVPAPPAVAGA